MGQLKTGIETLTKDAVTLVTMASTMKAKSEFHENHTNNKSNGLNKRVGAGYEVAALHLEEKFKKAGTTLAANAHLACKSLKDPVLDKILAGIKQAKEDLRAAIAKHNQEMAAMRSQYSVKSDAVKTTATTLTATAQKKKDKWLKSAKYKDKIKGYMSSIEVVTKALTANAVIAKTALKVTDIGKLDAWYPSGDALTVGNLREAASYAGGGLDIELTGTAQEARAFYASLDQQYKPLREQVKSLGNWTQDADAMEKEAI